MSGGEGPELAIPPSSKTDLDPILRPLCDTISRGMERHHIPGASIGLLYEGREYFAGFGAGNVDAPLPVTGDTLFQIGSITKTFTATAVMRLVEGGALDLDALVRTYLPELRLADEDAAAAVTVRHLLQHTAGWEGDLFQDTGRGDDALAKYVPRMERFPQIAPVGALYSYNNAAVTLAGRVIEAVTGSVYETAVRDLVLDPLGMTSTFFFPEEVMLRRFAVGHSVVDDRVEVTRGSRPDIPRGMQEWWALLRSCAPEGGLTSNVRDLLRYARFHLGDSTASDGPRLLTPESLKLMQTPAVATGSASWVGLSWFIREVGGAQIVSHDGGTNGQIAKLVLVPGRNMALAVLTNADSGGQLTSEVEKVVLASLLGIEVPEPVRQERSAAELLPYAGQYELSSGRIVVSVDDGDLVLERVPVDPASEVGPEPARRSARAMFCGDDEIVIVGGPMAGTRGDFLREAAGAIGWFRMGRAYRRERYE